MILRLPSLALNAQDFIWLNLNELLSFTCKDNQREFYTVAGIQTVVFIPNVNGVIELGTSNLIPANEQMQFQISTILSVYLSFVPLPIDPSWQTSSPSSLSSRSIDNSAKCSSQKTDEQINITPHSLSAFESFQPVLPFLQPSAATPYRAPLMKSPGVYLPQRAPPQPRSVPGQQPRGLPMQLFSQLASASASSSTSASVANIPGAFRRWRASSRIASPIRMGGSQVRIKRSVEILKHIHAERFRQMASATRLPSAPLSRSKVYHMISERRRRKKLKEFFDALRSLLPPGCREDKASILANTREYLSNLKSRVQELQQTNQELESLAKYREQAEVGEGGENTESSAPMATNVTVEEESAVPESIQTNEFGLTITVENPSHMIDVIISLLNSLRQMEVDMISFTSQTESASQLILNLRIRLPQETTGRQQIKQGIQKALGRPHS